MPDQSKPESEEGNHPQLDAVGSAVRCVEQDFRRLIDTLERVLDVLHSSDEDLSKRVVTVRDVAERGLTLSQQLLETMHHNRD
jgi:hypothetical protein